MSGYDRVNLCPEEAALPFHGQIKQNGVNSENKEVLSLLPTL
jgi:hypothetical protein